MKPLHSHTVRVRLVSSFALALLIISVPCLSAAQEKPKPKDEEPFYCGHTYSKPVMLPVIVTDKDNRPIATLTDEAFTIFEDNMPHKLAFFCKSSEPDCLASVGILFDTSGSQKINPLADELRNSLSRFTKVNVTTDEYFLLGFNDTVHLLTDWTREPGRIMDGINEITKMKGATAFFDALYTSVEKIKQGKNPRRALLLITDGQDNTSHHDLGQVKRLLIETGVVVYSVGIEESLAPDPLLAYGRGVLRDLSVSTGGAAFFPRTAKDVRKAFDRIALELGHQYFIGYYPTDIKHDGKWRRVKVSVKPIEMKDPSKPDKPARKVELKARAREGYYAPKP